MLNLLIHLIFDSNKLGKVKMPAGSLIISHKSYIQEAMMIKLISLE